MTELENISFPNIPKHLTTCHPRPENRLLPAPGPECPQDEHYRTSRTADRRNHRPQHNRRAIFVAEPLRRKKISLLQNKATAHSPTAPHPPTPPAILEFSPMPDTKSLSPDILLHIAKLLSVPMKGLVATVELLDEGGTVPFIARYRKEATGNLDEVQIRAIEEKLAYFRELEDRRETILRTIGEQGKLTGDLRARIEATLEKSELEDLYLPYKPKRRTKATIAREKGLEPLATYLWEQQPGPLTLAQLSATFVSAEKGVSTPKKLSKAHAISLPKPSPRMPTSAKGCAA